MRSLAVLIGFVFAVHGQPLSKRAGVGVGMPQQHVSPQQPRFASSRYQPAAPFTVQAPQERSQLDYRYSQNAIQTQLRAEAEGASASEPEYVNIYEEALEKCVEDDYCPYRSAEIASHDVCASFRTNMAVEASGMRWGAAANDPECENILAFGASGEKRRSKARGYVMIPQCSALPAGVLDSAFSLTMMEGITKKQHFIKPKFDKEVGSTNWLADGGLRDQKGTFLGGSATQYTRATKNFRRAINSICELCAAEAPNAQAKENLAIACAKIQALEAAAAKAEQETGAISALATGLVGAFVTGGTTFALLRFRSGAQVAGEEPFLRA